ncbi:MAG: Asp23/Gls24 family envelope stress response protein [Gaiella sp.]
MRRDTLLLKDTPFGKISISRAALERFVWEIVAESYGIVDMAGRRPLTPRGRARRGVDVRDSSEGIEIEIEIVVEFGLNLAEVAEAVRERVSYEVERHTGRTVSRVEVRIDDARRTA